MDKRYHYNGKIYCDEDLNEEVDNYGGDLFDLYWDLKTAGEAKEHTSYYSSQDSEKYYDSAEELIENEFAHLEV